MPRKVLFLMFILSFLILSAQAIDFKIGKNNLNYGKYRDGVGLDTTGSTWFSYSNAGTQASGPIESQTSAKITAAIGDAQSQWPYLQEMKEYETSDVSSLYFKVFTYTARDKLIPMTVGEMLPANNGRIPFDYSDVVTIYPTGNFKPVALAKTSLPPYEGQMPAFMTSLTDSQMYLVVQTANTPLSYRPYNNEYKKNPSFCGTADCVIPYVLLVSYVQNGQHYCYLLMNKDKTGIQMIEKLDSASETHKKIIAALPAYINPKTKPSVTACGFMGGMTQADIKKYSKYYGAIDRGQLVVFKKGGLYTFDTTGLSGNPPKLLVAKYDEKANKWGNEMVAFLNTPPTVASTGKTSRAG